MSDLSTLLSRVESGSGADRELDRLIATTLGGWVHQPNVGHNFKWHDGVRYVPGPTPRYTTDLSAVIALARDRYPACRVMVESDHDGSGWAMFQRSPKATSLILDAPTPARALLAALIRAEMEKVK